MAELLTSRADKWFQASRLQGADWITFRREFLKFFLLPRYLQRLDDQIRSREQLERETFKDFMLDLRVLMRHAGYNETQELDRLYENVAPEYQMYIRRSEFRTIGELAQLATEFEAVQKRSLERNNYNHASKNATTYRPPSQGRTQPAFAERNPQGNQPRASPEPRAALPARVNRVAASDRRNDVRDACRNCGAPGHYSQEEDCRNPRQYFCWLPSTTGKRDGSTRPAESVGTQSTREPSVTSNPEVNSGSPTSNARHAGTFNPRDGFSRFHWHYPPMWYSKPHAVSTKTRRAGDDQT